MDLVEGWLGCGFYDGEVVIERLEIRSERFEGVVVVIGKVKWRGFGFHGGNGVGRWTVAGCGLQR